MSYDGVEKYYKKPALEIVKDQPPATFLKEDCRHDAPRPPKKEEPILDWAEIVVTIITWIVFAAMILAAPWAFMLVLYSFNCATKYFFP